MIFPLNRLMTGVGSNAEWMKSTRIEKKRYISLIVLYLWEHGYIQSKVRSKELELFFWCNLITNTLYFNFSDLSHMAICFAYHIFRGSQKRWDQSLKTSMVDWSVISFGSKFKKIKKGYWKKLTKDWIVDVLQLWWKVL